MMTSQQQVILGVLAATDRLICLADAVANTASIVSKEEEEKLRHEIVTLRTITETARNHLRIQISTHVSSRVGM